MENIPYSSIPKVNKPEKPAKYGPIFVLLILSKDCERVILYQMTLHIEKKIIYYSYQSGYRKNYSTLTILIKVRDDTERAMENREVILAVFLNFSKAFGTIHFNTLIQT